MYSKVMSYCTRESSERRKNLLVCLSILCMVWIASGAHAQTWVEDTFEDFADGILDAWVRTYM